MRDSYVDISSYFYPEYKCLRIGRGVTLPSRFLILIKIVTINHRSLQSNSSHSRYLYTSILTIMIFLSYFFPFEVFEEPQNGYYFLPEKFYVGTTPTRPRNGDLSFRWQTNHILQKLYHDALFLVDRSSFFRSFFVIIGKYCRNDFNFVWTNYK